MVKILSPRRLPLVIAILFVSCVVSLAYAQEPDQNEELLQLRSEYKEALSKNKFEQAYDALKSIVKRHESDYKFDSVIIYNRRLSNLGFRMSDAPKGIYPLVENLNIEVVLTRGIKDFGSRVDSLFVYVDDERIDPFTRAIICHHKQTILVGQDSLERAEEVILKGIAICFQHNIDIATRVDLQVLLSNIYNRQRRYIDCINILTDADAALDKVEDYPVVKSRVHKGLHNVLRNIGDYDKAYYYAEKSLALGQKVQRNEIITDSYEKMADARLKQKKYDEAVVYYNKAIDLLRGSKLNRALLSCYQGLLLTYLEQANYGQAKIALDSSRQYQQFDESSNYKEMFIRLSARYYTETGQLDKALEYLDKMNSKKGNTNYLYYLYHKEKKNEDEALWYYEKYMMKQDSIKSMNQSLKVQQLESEYNRDKQNVEIDNLNELNIAQDKSLAIKNTALWVGGVMLIVLIGLLFGLYKLYMRNKNNQAVLASQNVQISKALSQNKVLIKEIHHRVKNNLQVVSSLLSMQARKVTDSHTKDALNTSKTRVQSMSILHQNLYRGDNLKGVEVEKYLDEVVQNIIDTYAIGDQIEFNIDIDPMALDIDVLVPIGLIVNELVCNSLKHAFPGGRSGKLDISFKNEENAVRLSVIDDGVGLPNNEIPAKQGSLGTRLIHSFVQTLEGEMTIDGSHGTKVSILYPKEKIGLS